MSTDKSDAKVDGFTMVHHSLFRSGAAFALGPNAVTVLLAIASYASKEGKCYPKTETIADITHLSVSSVIRAKRLLKAHGFLDYKTSRERIATKEKKEDGSTKFIFRNRQDYTVPAIKGRKILPSAVGDIDAGQHISTEASTNMKVLNTYIEAMPDAATYFRTHMVELKKAKIFPEALDEMRKAGGSPDNVYLYYALATLNCLKHCADQIQKTVKLRVDGHVPNVVRFMDSMMQASLTVGTSYEDAILSFMCWIRDKKSGKDLNFGILPLLAKEWQVAKRSR